MYEQRLRFTFEAAHELAATSPARAAGEGHPYARLHGHSFVATAVLRAESLGPDGWVADFSAARAACGSVKQRLDHRLLNEIEGLETPTLERLAAWVFAALKADLPALARVEIERPTLGELAAFEPS
ncbi:MAG: 6-carboxytetrahydropterin synthase [Pseudomonadota bacterium]